MSTQSSELAWRAKGWSLVEGWLIIPRTWRQQQRQCEAAKARARAAAAAASPLRYIFFGDSFVRLFTLLSNKELKVQGFKGATAKGLGRDFNVNRVEIEEAISQNPNLEHCVFVFGNVDVHLSPYFLKYSRGGEEIDLEAIAGAYVRFVATLPGDAQKLIIGVYPSSLETSKVAFSLVCYGILTEEQAAAIPQGDLDLRARQTRVRDFNAHLARQCEAHGVQYADVFDEMTNGALEMRGEYLDVSEANIHVVWETTIFLWLQKLPWLAAHAPRDFERKTRASLAKYIATKPWGTREHPSGLGGGKGGGAVPRRGGGSKPARGDITTM